MPIATRLTNTGTLLVNGSFDENTSFSLVAEALVVGGGGAGGHLGGGGAGGHRYFTNQSLVSATNYTVTVGAGGAASTAATGASGSNSVFNTYTSAGGGGGAGEAALPTAGGSGGGGGGLSGTSRPGAAGNTPSTSPSQGNTGGNGNDNGVGQAFAGGGGGGAGTAGFPASTVSAGGIGGLGSANSITGTSVTRAAGGGGGAYQINSTGSSGPGGSSIGGNGGRNGLNATSGSPNTGSGGGGNGLNSSGNLQGSSGAGGSGVVILKYPNTYSISNPGGGLTFTTDSASVAGYNITTFTAGTGQISFTALTKFRTTSNTVFASEFDEFTGAPIVDSNLQLWLDAGQTSSYPGTGTTWTDLSGNGRTGTLTSGPTYSATNGGSIVFDGTNDFVLCSGSLTVTAATFVAWIRRDGTQNPYSGIIFCRELPGGGATNNVSGLAIGQTGTSNQIGYTWHGQSSSYFFTSNLTIPNLTWCMIAVSVTSTAATLYLCQTSGITTATNTTSHPSTLLDDIKIGVDDATSTTRFFKGNIASAQIYNRALTAAEVVQNYNALQSRYGLASITSTQMPVVQRQQSSGTLLVNGEFDEVNMILQNADLYISPATTLANVANGTTVGGIQNLGISGAIYDASSGDGPAVATQNGVKVLQFDSSYKQLTMATEIDLSTNSSVFFVGYQTASRLIALGGSASSSNGNAFLGWSGTNNAAFLFRNSTDGGQTLTGLTSVAGLKVFGIIQGTSTFTYYDNRTTPTSGTYVSGTYRFKKLGARDYSGTINGQLSTGYLGDVVAFNRVVSNDEAVLIMKLLKERYNIQ